MFVAIRAVEGLYANVVYEKQYDHWRWDKAVPSGVNMLNLGFGVFLALAIVPLTIYRFTASKPEAWVTGFPANKNVFTSVAGWLENGFDNLAESGADLFNGITWAIRTILDGLEVLLVGTPWPVVMLVIVVTAWRIAGPRVAVFTVAALAYLAFLGYWDKSNGDGRPSGRRGLPVHRLRRSTRHLVRQERARHMRSPGRCSTSCRPCRPLSI